MAGHAFIPWPVCKLAALWDTCCPSLVSQYPGVCMVQNMAAPWQGPWMACLLSWDVGSMIAMYLTNLPQHKAEWKIDGLGSLKRCENMEPGAQRTWFRLKQEETLFLERRLEGWLLELLNFLGLAGGNWWISSLMGSGSQWHRRQDEKDGRIGFRPLEFRNGLDLQRRGMGNTKS